MWLRFALISVCLAIHPPNGGYKHEVQEITLFAGTHVDRYGSTHGRYVSPFRTPFWQRSLPLTMLFEAPYHFYLVVKDIEGVHVGFAASWHGQFGCGIQYRLPKSIQELLNQGYLI
jgi:hypothetical protein